MATIADKLTTIAGIKTDIRTAINNKGGSLTSGSPFSAYSAAISSLPSGGGGGASSTDWSQIGYTGAPQAVSDAFSYAKNIYDNWDPTVTNLMNKFDNDKNLVYMPLVDTSNATSMQGMFSGCTNMTCLPLLITSNVTNMQCMLKGCSDLAAVPLFDTSNVTNMNSMFHSCTNMTCLPLLITSNVTDMSHMFHGCSGLASVPLFDTSNVTDMSGMFTGCTSLASVPAFNTSACLNMNQMFNSCSKLTYIPALDTSQVVNMQYTFSNCNSLQKITSLDMSKCTGFSNMFGWGLGTLRFMLLKGLGTPSGVTSYDNSKMDKVTNWGVDSTEIPDARQSLVDTLLTYSFDRATAGYSTCKIKLSSNSYNQLTAQELADIQAKGYNITT